MKNQILDHPDQIGPYRIIQVIGEGGMGVVYDAEQREPVRRRVAVKMMKVGMDTKEVLGRFETERQALAVMEHPGIAKVFDGGATENGRPYFVMELVKGMALDEFCDHRRLGTRGRVELFIDICHAVQHAHQKGVIHRDLKPSNVLVVEEDGRPAPKVIDFGIAKATGQRLNQETVVTTYGQALGTLAYMSPEQAEMSGLDVDTRADVYSLGVMLFELITGSVPLDPMEISPPAFLAKLIRRDQPMPTLSQRLTTLDGDRLDAVSQLRATDPGRLRKELSGDLQWIVAKAIEKDRSDRYGTAFEMGMDLERFLHHEPVVARAPSAAYRVGKFVRRHRVGVGLTAVVAALVGGFAVSTRIQAMIIAEERDRAELAAAKATAINDFMLETLGAADPVAGVGREVTVAEALGRAAGRVDVLFDDQPEVAAAVKSAIGGVYLRLDLLPAAEPLLREALASRETLLGPAHPDLAESLHQWAGYQAAAGDYEAAVEVHRRALEMRRSLLGDESSEVASSLLELGQVLTELGLVEDAEIHLREAIRIVESGGDTEDLAGAYVRLGHALWSLGDLAGAEPVWERALDIRGTLFGEEHPSVAEVLNNLAVLYDNTDRPALAEPLYRQALVIQTRLLGTEHTEVAALTLNLAILLDTQGEYEEAEELYREALRIDVQLLGEAHPYVAGDRVNLASFLCEQDQAAEGARMARVGLSGFESTLEAGNWQIGNAHQWLGRCLSHLARYPEAEAEFLRGIDILSEALGADHYRVSAARERLVEVYELWGRPDMAEAERAKLGVG